MDARHTRSRPGIPPEATESLRGPTCRCRPGHSAEPPTAPLTPAPQYPGRGADLGEAFAHGFRRAGALFPWTVVAGAGFAVGWALLVLPGVYAAYALSLFGMVAVFERGVNPLQRSVGLTHNSVTLGPTIGRVGIAFVGYSILAGIAHLIFGIIGAVFTVGAGVVTRGGFSGIAYDVVTSIGELCTGPAFAVLLVCLLPTYAELRAGEWRLVHGPAPAAPRLTPTRGPAALAPLASRPRSRRHRSTAPRPRDQPSRGEWLALDRAEC